MMTPSNLPGFRPFIGVVIGVSLVIGFLVIFQSMLHRSHGTHARNWHSLNPWATSKLYIVELVLREPVLLALAGILVGVLFSPAARVGIEHRWPLVHIDKSNEWMIRSAVIAILGRDGWSNLSRVQGRAKRPPLTRWPTSD